MVYRDEILRALHSGELPPDMCDLEPHAEDLLEPPVAVALEEMDPNQVTTAGKPASRASSLNAVNSV